jgi:hypothetical protein
MAVVPAADGGDLRLALSIPIYDSLVPRGATVVFSPPSACSITRDSLFLGRRNVTRRANHARLGALDLDA